MIDWPLFHGNVQQTGYAEDVGPSEGKLAWKFPVGYAWYSRPVIEDGRIYVASPGMRTVFLCLDKNGRIIWKAKRATRPRLSPYMTSRIASSPLVLRDKIIVREGQGSFLLYINKSDGKITRKIKAGYLEYRVEPTIVAASEDVIVTSLGTTMETVDRTIIDFGEVRTAWHKNPNLRYPKILSEHLICIDVSSGEILWNFRAGMVFCEPLIDEAKVYVGTYDGLFYCLNVKGPERIAWQFKAGAAANSSPAVLNDKVYFGANDGVVYCLDKLTGELKWRYEVNDKEPRAFRLFSTPIVAEERLYTGAANKQLYCLDAETGKLIWRHEVGDWIRSQPAVDGEKVYVASTDGTLYCLSQKDGKVTLEWKTKVGTHQIFSDLALSNKEIFITSSDLYLFCIQTKDGAILWKHDLLEEKQRSVFKWTNASNREQLGGGNDHQSSPIVADGKVFIGTPTHFVYALDHKTGYELWKFEVGGQIPATPVYSNDRIFFGDYGGTDFFYCVDAKDGSPVWRQKLGIVWSSANVWNGKVFVPGCDGYFYCLSEENGVILWRYKTGRDIYTSPPVYEGRVYFGSWDGWLYALDVEQGNLLWKFRLPLGAFDSGAIVADYGKVFLPYMFGKGIFYCLEAKTGNILWEFKPVPPGWGFNSTCAVHNKRIFLSGSHAVFCLDEEKGTLIWKHPKGGGLTGPAVADGKVYFGSTTDPFFYCVDEKGNKDGTTKCLWKFRMGDATIESCTAISGGKAFILCSDCYLYAFK